MHYYSIAKILQTAQDYEKAYKFYEKGSLLGCVKCDFGRALCFYEGLFVEKDESKSISIINNIYSSILDLANSGDREAMCLIAYCFNNAIFVEKDEELAEEWLKKARQPLKSSDKIIDDYFLVSRMIYESHNEKKDYRLSIEYLLSVANLGSMIGDTRCLHYLSICNFFGIGTNQDESISSEMNNFCFSECMNLSENGDSHSMYILYLAYFNGLGTQPDKEIAKKWLVKSACYGDDFAKYKIACHYLDENDIVFGFDEEKAINWLNLSAKLGNIFAINKLELIGKDVSGLSQKDYFNIDLLEDESLKEGKNLSQKFDANLLKKQTNKYLNNLENIDKSLLWIERYNSSKKDNLMSLNDCKLFADEIYKFQELNSFVKEFLGQDVCKFFEDYIKLNDCILGMSQFFDELYNSCIVNIEYTKKSHLFGIIKITEAINTIKIEETSILKSLRNDFVSSLEGNLFEEAKQLYRFLKSISQDIKNLGTEENLETMIQFASKYNKANNIAKIFYTAQYVQKFGFIIEQSDVLSITPDFSNKISKKYPYFNAILGNCSRIYLSDIYNLK